MNLNLEAIALDLLLDSDDGTLSVSSGGIHLDFRTSTGLHPLRRAVRALLLSEETSLSAKLLAEQRMTKLEEIRELLVVQPCMFGDSVGYALELSNLDLQFHPQTCAPCLARALGANRETP